MFYAFPFVLDGTLPQHPLIDGRRYDFTFRALNLRGLGAEAMVSATPTDMPEAPPERVPTVARTLDGVALNWDAVDADVEVAAEFRPSERDPMGNVEGFQRLLDGASATTHAEIRDLAEKSEARVRLVAQRNPGTAGREVVVDNVGHTRTTKARMLLDWFDEDPGGPGALVSMVRQLVSTRIGQMYYTHARPRFEDERDPESEVFRETGAWKSPGDYDRNDLTDTTEITQIAGHDVHIPRKWVCHTPHQGATVETEPGVGALYRQFWREFDASIAIDPERRSATPDEATRIPATRLDLPYDDVAEFNDPSGSVNEPGEFVLGRRNSGNAFVRLLVWEHVKTLCEVLGIAVLDADGVDRTAYHLNLRPGDIVVAWWSARRWIAFTIYFTRLSRNGKRCLMDVSPIAYDERDGTEDVTDGPMLFRFSRAAEIVTTREGTGVPTVVRNLSPVYDRANAEIDSSWLAPTSGATPFGYDLGYFLNRTADRFPMDAGAALQRSVDAADVGGLPNRIYKVTCRARNPGGQYGPAAEQPLDFRPAASTVLPGHSESVLMDDIALDGDDAPEGDGQFSLGRRTVAGAFVRMDAWTDVREMLTTLSLSMTDRAGAGVDVATGAGGWVVVYLAGRRWIRCDIHERYVSGNGRRLVFGVTPRDYDQRGGGGAIVDGNVEFRFG